MSKPLKKEEVVEELAGKMEQLLEDFGMIGSDALQLADQWPSQVIPEYRSVLDNPEIKNPAFDEIEDRWTEIYMDIVFEAMGKLAENHKLIRSQDA